ncbi:Peroxidase [Trema orientale]|uniref:Peroxidase n=1 Tax=Trema orientale TaxID=63057 RepID=A0A2P5BHC4_TREOI|nr:Peroxidase [Trema orientale]
MQNFSTSDPSLVAALLRMHFHDCFVEGCDASILVDKNSNGKATEKFAAPNLSVRGYDVIDSIKTTLEQKCPGVVSCADIIVMATRDAVNFSSRGAVQYRVETGRLDGKISDISNVNLPSPKISVVDSIKAFDQKGLNTTDMVYLLGGHTVGVAHCGFFQDRLYNFRGTGKPDPTMDPNLVTELQSKCPPQSTGGNSVDLDQNKGSSLTVDKSYYEQLLRNRGILEIDQNLASSGLTNMTVIQIANSPDFGSKFGEAMRKLGRVEVKTSLLNGEIRTSCRAVNTN